MRSKLIVQTLLGAIAMMALFIGLCTRPAAADGSDTVIDYFGGPQPYNAETAPKYYPTLQPFCTSAYNAILADHGGMTENWCGEPAFPDNQFAYNVDGHDYAVHVATHYILTCHAGQGVRWNGNDSPPQCVDGSTPDCSAKSGTTTTISQQCGQAICAIGSTWVKGTDNKFGCSSGNQSLTPGATPHPSPANISGCEAVYTQTVAKRLLNADAGKQSAPVYCSDQYTYTGQVANGSDADPNGVANSGLSSDTRDPTDGGCPAGTFHGTGPLGESCYGTPTDGANSGSPNGTGNSGGVPNGTGNSGGTGNNPDGTANSGSPDGTSNSGGSGGGAHGTANSGSNSGCVDCSAGTSGKCTAPPDCSGDAIQCAILVQSWKNTCYMTSTPDDGQQGTAAEAVASGGRDYSTQQQGFSDGVKGIMDSFWQKADGRQYAGACPQDITIPYVNGQQFVIRISQWCSAMQVFRVLLLAFAYLSAARIIFNAAL